MRVGLVQLTSGEDPVSNYKSAEALVRKAAKDGARIVFTPEVTNLLSPSRDIQAEKLTVEEQDFCLIHFRELAQLLGVWINIGSLALKRSEPNGRYANRSFLIDPMGQIVSRYDKLHMFDADISKTVRLKESDVYCPGGRAVLSDVDRVRMGLTICYDLRFPYLYRDLALAGAHIITCPSAFTVPTGRAHWHTLLKARAIETGCYIIAAAQTGQHPSKTAKKRESFGHSLVVDPWGEVVLDAGVDIGAHVVDLDISLVEKTRNRIPSLYHTAHYTKPVHE